MVSIGNGLPPPLHVPPSWFRATSTVSSSSEPRVCCNTLPTLGFTGFVALAGNTFRRLSTLRSLPPGCSLLVVTTPLARVYTDESYPPGLVVRYRPARCCQRDG